jgi:hypothetical protein
MSVAYRVKTQLEVSKEVATEYFKKVCELMGWTAPVKSYGLLSTKVRDGKYDRARTVYFDPANMQVTADSDYQELVDICDDIPNYLMMVDIQARLKQDDIDSSFVLGEDGSLELKLPESIQGVEAFDLL